MLSSTIAYDEALAELVAVLARLSCASADLDLLERVATGVETELARFERAFQRGGADGHDAFLAAVKLAVVLDRISGDLVAPVDRIVRFRATASRILAMIGPFASATDRQIATRLECLHSNAIM